MARPRKNNAEYFSHDANLRNNIKIRALRSKYPQNIGYSAYNMLLEIMTDADNFRLENNDLQNTLIAWDIGLDEDLYTDILEFMVTIGLMQRDPEWIWNDHLLERMQPVLNKRKVMQEKYQVRGEKPAETPPAPPKPAKAKKETLTEEQWKEFIQLYNTWETIEGSIYKAKNIFLKLPSTYKNTISNAMCDTWEDIKAKIPLYKKSDKWMRWYKHNATTWINGHMWEGTPEPYNHNKGKAPNQQNNGKASSKSGYSDHKV